MPEAIHNRPAPRRRRPGAASASAVLLAAGGLALALPAQAAGDGARNLTVEQTAVHAVQAPAPAAGGADRLGVTAWVDRTNNTYAVGEQVRLFVKPSKDAWITVLNVGPSGRTTMLFPNAHQKDNKVSGNRTVEIPSPASGTSIKVGAPVGRELIKVVASTSPTPLFPAVKMTRAAPFPTLGAGARAVARDLQVTMDTQANQEWDDYNKVITTVTSH